MYYLWKRAGSDAPLAQCEKPEKETSALGLVLHADGRDQSKAGSLVSKTPYCSTQKYLDSRGTRTI
jgi:hypothetical protein